MNMIHYLSILANKLIILRILLIINISYTLHLSFKLYSKLAAVKQHLLRISYSMLIHYHKIKIFKNQVIYNYQ